MTEREEFEAEYRKRSKDRDDYDVDESLRLDKDGEYLYGDTWTAFYWWQAARATPALPQGVEEWIAANSHPLYFADSGDGFGSEAVFVDELRKRLSGMAIVPVGSITSVARDVDYLLETPRRTEPFVRINFAPEDYDSRDAIHTMLAAAKEKQS